MSNMNLDAQRLATLQRQWTVKCSDLIELYKLYIQAEFHYYKHLRKNLLLKLRALGLPYHLSKDKALELRESYQQRVALLEEQLAWLKKQQLRFPGVGVAHDQFLQQNLDARIFNYYLLKQRELPQQTPARVLSAQYYLLSEIQRFYADLWSQGYFPCWARLLNVMHELWLPHLSDHEVGSWLHKVQQVATQAQELRSQAVQAKVTYAQEQLDQRMQAQRKSENSSTANSEVDSPNLGEDGITIVLDEQGAEAYAEEYSVAYYEVTDTAAAEVLAVAQDAGVEQPIHSTIVSAQVTQADSVTSVLTPAQDEAILAQDLWSLFADLDEFAEGELQAGAAQGESRELETEDAQHPTVQDESKQVEERVSNATKSQAHEQKKLQVDLASSNSPSLSLHSPAGLGWGGFTRERELWRKVYALGQQLTTRELVHIWSGSAGVGTDGNHRVSLTSDTVNETGLLGDALWQEWTVAAQEENELKEQEAQLAVDHFYLRKLWNGWGLETHDLAKDTAHQLYQQNVKLQQLTGKLENFIARVQLYLEQTELNFNRPLSTHKTQLLQSENAELAAQLAEKTHLTVNPLESPLAPIMSETEPHLEVEDFLGTQNELNLDELRGAEGGFSTSVNLAESERVGDGRDAISLTATSTPTLKLTTINKIANFLTPDVNLSELEQLGSQNVAGQLEHLLQEHWETFLQQLEQVVVPLRTASTTQLQAKNAARLQRLHQAVAQLLAPEPQALVVDVAQIAQQLSSGVGSVHASNYETSMTSQAAQVELPWSLARTQGILSWTLRHLSQLYPEFTTAQQAVAAPAKSRGKKQGKSQSLALSISEIGVIHEESLHLPAPLSWLAELAQQWQKQLVWNVCGQLITHLVNHKWLAGEMAQVWLPLLQQLQQCGNGVDRTSSMLRDAHAQTLLRTLYFSLKLLQVHLGSLTTTAQLTANIQVQAHELLRQSGGSSEQELKDYSLKDSARNLRTGKYALDNLPWGTSLFELFGEELLVHQVQNQPTSLQVASAPQALTSGSDSLASSAQAQDLNGEIAHAGNGSGAARDAAVGDEWQVTDARRERVDHALARYLTHHKMQASAQCARVPFVYEAVEKPFARYGELRDLNNLVGINLGCEVVPIPEVQTERDNRASYEARIAQGVQTGHLTYLEDAHDTIAYLVDVTVTIPPSVTQTKFHQLAQQHYQRYVVQHREVDARSLQEVLGATTSSDGTTSELDIDIHHPYVFKFRVRVSREVLLPDHTSFNLNTRVFASELYKYGLGKDLYDIERHGRMRGMLPGLRTYGDEVKPLTREQLEQIIIEIAYAQAQRQLAHTSLQNGNPDDLRCDATTGEAMPQLDLTELPQPQILLEQVNAWDGKGKPVVLASLTPTLKALWLQAGELARNYALGITGYDPETTQAQDVSCADFTKVSYQPNNYYLNGPQGQQELYLALALAEHVSELFAQQEAQQGRVTPIVDTEGMEADLSLTPTQALEQLRRFVKLHRDVLQAQLGQAPSRDNNYSYLGYYDNRGHWQHIIKPQFLLDLVFHPASYPLLYELRQQQAQQRALMQQEQLRQQQEQAQSYRAQWMPKVLQRDENIPVLPSADPLFRTSHSQLVTRVGIIDKELLTASEADALTSDVTQVLQESSLSNLATKSRAAGVGSGGTRGKVQQTTPVHAPPAVSASGQRESSVFASKSYDKVWEQSSIASLRARFKGKLYSERLRNLEQNRAEQQALRQVAAERGGVVAHPSQQVQLERRLAQLAQEHQQRRAFPGKFLTPRKLEIPNLQDLWHERTFKNWGNGVIRPPSFKLILQIEAQRRGQVQLLRHGWQAGMALGPEEIDANLLFDPQQMYPSYEEIPQEYPRPPEQIPSYAQQVQRWYEQERVREQRQAQEQEIAALQANVVQDENKKIERQLAVADQTTTSQEIDLNQAEVWGDMVALPLEAMFISPEQQAQLAEQKLQSLSVRMPTAVQASSNGAMPSVTASLNSSSTQANFTSVAEQGMEHAVPSQFNANFGTVWAREFGKGGRLVSTQGVLSYLRDVTQQIAAARATTAAEIYQHELPPAEGFPVRGGKVLIQHDQVAHVVPGTLLTPQVEKVVREAEFADYVATFPSDAQAEFKQETITRDQAEQRVYDTPDNDFAALDATQQQALQEFVARDLSELLTDLDLDEGTSLESLVASLEMQDGKLYQREITSQLLESYDVRKLRPTTERVIFHCDINNCYASIEQQLNPELKGKPIAVTGNVENRHGIVLAKSNQAKKYGIKTGDTVHQAMQKCPHLICVPPHSHIYKQFSNRAHQIYACYTDMIESFGIDEVWLDVTDVVHHYESPVHLAHLIRKRIHQELGVTISVGVSFNKVFAKLGSDLKKPNAVTEINYYNYEKLLYPLAIEEMVGIGRSTRTALQKAGIYTIGDLAQADFNMIATRFGYGGKIAWINANGLNFSAVAHMHDRPKEKSIGHGLTFKEDLTSYAEVYAAFQELALDVAQRLIKSRKYARAIQISVRDKDFATRQFQAPLKQPSYSALEFARLASELFQTHVTEPFAVRQLTIRAINLIYQAEIDEFPDFEGLFNADPEHERNLRMQETLTMVREKFGKHTLNFASSLLNTKVGNRNTIPFADKIVHAEKKYLEDDAFVERSDWDGYGEAILEHFCVVEPSES